MRKKHVHDWDLQTQHFEGPYFDLYSFFWTCGCGAVEGKLKEREALALYKKQQKRKLPRKKKVVSS